jgi:hypothetical protein
MTNESLGVESQTSIQHSQGMVSTYLKIEAIFRMALDPAIKHVSDQKTLGKRSRT